MLDRAMQAFRVVGNGRNPIFAAGHERQGTITLAASSSGVAAMKLTTCRKPRGLVARALTRRSEKRSAPPEFCGLGATEYVTVKKAVSGSSAESRPRAEV